MKAFIFDMDGVIIDSEILHARAKSDALHHYGIMDEINWDNYTGMSSRDTYRKILQDFNVKSDVTPEMLTDYKHDRYMEIIKDEELHGIAGACELIRSLAEAGVTVALASSSWMKAIDMVTDRLNIRQYFKFIISGADLPHSKPDPMIYLKTAEALGVAPGDCVVLEDTTNGIKAAKAAGMYCIAYINPTSGKQDLSMADRIVKSEGEIKVTDYFA